MSDQEVIETLARQEGWRNHKFEVLRLGASSEWFESPSGDRFMSLPHYLTSIDALRPVLERLSEEQWVGFQANLLRLAQQQLKHDDNRSAWRWLLTLPPATLARAIAEVIKDSR